MAYLYLICLPLATVAGHYLSRSREDTATANAQAHQQTAKLKDNLTQLIAHSIKSRSDAAFD